MKKAKESNVIEHDPSDVESGILLSVHSAKKSLEAAAQTVFTPKQLIQFIQEQKEQWLVEETGTAKQAALIKKGLLAPLHTDAQSDIQKLLLQKAVLKVVKMPFPYRAETRFTFGDVPTQILIQSLSDDGYFSHFSAMHLLGLTDQIPKTFYFNVEQPATGGGGTLSQQSIDNAFRGKCRVSNNVVTLGQYTICKLNGQNTGQLGVIRHSIDQGVVRVTNVERTLIDATVRPIYSGGVAQVAQAFVEAAEKVSVNKIATYLRKMNFTYPYHQAIGFYLEKSGKYKESQLQLMRQFPMEYDFYLTYQIKEKRYVPKWKLFVPEGF